MGETWTSVLRTMRSPKVVNGLGLGFVGGHRPLARRQLRQGPDVLHQHRARRPHAWLDLRRRRARVHARLRHPSAHQLRAWRRVRPLGPRREHGDALDSRPDGRIEQRSRRRRRAPDARHHAAALRCRQRRDRARRLPPAPERPAASSPDHGCRDVVHHLQPVARALRRRVQERLGAHSAGHGDLDRTGRVQLEAHDRARDHRAGAHRPQLVRALDAAGQGDARRRPGHRGVGDDGHQRQPDDLGDVLPRRLARRGRPVSCTSSSTRFGSTAASSSA